MAIRKGNFILGSIQNLVFKKRQNKQILQSSPGKGNVKQTQATKKSAYLFGQASMLGKSIRVMSEDLIFGFHDGPMINRLTKELQQILLHYYPIENEIYQFETDSFDQLNGFDFNLNSPLNKSLWVTPIATLTGNNLQIILPEIKIPGELKFPEKSSSCTITISTNYFDLEQGHWHVHPELRKVEVKNDQLLLEKQEFSFLVPNGCLCITGIAIQYFSKKHNLTVLYNDKAFNPAQICSALVSPGTFTLEKGNAWRRTKWSKAAFDKYATINQASPHLQPSYNLHTCMEPNDSARF